MGDASGLKESDRQEVDVRLNKECVGTNRTSLDAKRQRLERMGFLRLKHLNDDAVTLVCLLEVQCFNEESRLQGESKAEKETAALASKSSLMMRNVQLQCWKAPSECTSLLQVHVDDRFQGKDLRLRLDRQQAPLLTTPVRTSAPTHASSRSNGYRVWTSLLLDLES